jgi:diguanylate cyclase (GGDEF)-like protein
MQDFMDIQASRHLDYEKERKSQLIFLLTALSLVYLACFTIATVILHRYAETIVLGSIFFIDLINILIFRVQRNISVAGNIMLIATFFMVAFLFYAGGIENSGFIWMFLFTPVAYYLQGLKAGCIWSGLLFITNVVIYLLSFTGFIPVHFPPLYIVVIFSAYLLSAFFIMLYEIVQDRYEGIISEHSRKLIELNEELKHIAQFDFLTGVHNRRVIEMMIRMEMERFRRFDIYFTLIMLDIDNFKALNDCFGHQFGDQVLQKIAETIQHSIRDIDRVGRYGGEEFMIMLPSTHIESAQIVADRLLIAVRSLNNTTDTGIVVPVTVSMGIAEIEKNVSEEELIKCVDQAMYQAKSCGKDCIMLYHK